MFDTCQACQSTQVLQDHEGKISMDGKGKYQDNIFVERRWRTVRHEEVYLKPYSNGHRGSEGTGRLPPVLQQLENPSGPGLPGSGQGVPRGHQYTERGIEGEEKLTGTDAGLIARNSGTLA